MTTQLTNKLHYTKNSRHYIHKIVRSKRERVNRAHWYMNSEAKTIMVLKQILDTLLCENFIRGPQKVPSRETETGELFWHLNQFREQHVSLHT